MRKRRVLTVAAIFPWALCASALAQDAAETSGQPVAKGAGQAAQNLQVVDAAAPQMSLAEMAKLARATRTPDAKARKVVLDDDNMVRGTYAVDTAASRGSGSDGGFSLAGGPFGEYHGKVVVLDFWATWCGPCRRALSGVRKLQATYGGDQFVVVSISADDDQETWRSFVASNHMTWPQRLDGDGDLRRRFGVHAFPTYILLAPDGNVLERYEGEDEASSIAERLGPEVRTALAPRSKETPAKAPRPVNAH